MARGRWVFTGESQNHPERVQTGRVEKAKSSKENVANESKVASLLEQFRRTSDCYFNDNKRQLSRAKKFDSQFYCRDLNKKHKNPVWIDDEEAHFPLEMKKYLSETATDI